MHSSKCTLHNYTASVKLSQVIKTDIAGVRVCVYVNDELVPLKVQRRWKNVGTLAVSFILLCVLVDSIFLSVYLWCVLSGNFKSVRYKI